jgi:hypothetical protein
MTATACHAVLTALMLAGALLCAVRPVAAAPRMEPKFCNLIFADTESDQTGLRRFIDGARARKLEGRLKLTLLLHSDTARADKSGSRAFYREMADQGHEIGVFFADARPIVAAWLGLPEERITTVGFQLFGDVDVEEQARATQRGFTASVNACIEGDSFVEERWDIPHNWEGAPYLPYWVQWDAARPETTARVNRELTKRRATLELQWATRTMWHNYDRICLPQCFHFGEPVKHSQWPIQQLSRRGDIGWWKAEVAELEANLAAGRTPLLYLNTASEANVFVPGGPWTPMLDTDEALECALDLAEYLIQRGWQLVTVQQFVDWFSARWPCPSAPSAAYLMKDTLAGLVDKQGLAIPSHGRLLHAETRHFQVIDHENRMSPEMVVAYDLATPNLLRGGYTFGDPAVHGAGQNPGQYAATTGNALFWSPSPPLANAKGEPFYHVNKPAAARDRTFTLYVGDEWAPYQFAAARFTRVRRIGSEVRWTKEMARPVAGSDVRLRMTHRLVGEQHRVRVEVLGKGALDKPVRLRLSPMFHQGWDRDYRREAPPSDSIADPATAGQERNVFGHAAGVEFAYSESNAERTVRRVPLPRGACRIGLFNRNPGHAPGSPGWTVDDNPDMNRGVTLSLRAERGASVAFIDEPGPGKYVTVEVEFGAHRAGQAYEFTFTYRHGDVR